MVLLLTLVPERFGLTYGAAGARRLKTLLLVGVVTALGVNFDKVDRDFCR